MKSRVIRILLALLALLAASLACNLPSSGSSRPPTAAPMDAGELQNLQDQLQETLSAASGEIAITLTEPQINSLLSTAQAQQNEQIISDTVVKLTNGAMEVYGKMDQGAIAVDLKIVLKPGVDASGNPALDIQDFTIGSFQAPDEMKNKVSNLVAQAIQQYLSGQNQDFKATEITIEEGKMTVSGSIQQP